MRATRIARLFMAAVISVATMLPMGLPAAAASERALYLYYTHTKETARIVFKRDGRYIQSGLNELNHFLRDWRRDEPAKMDPRLFDLVWEVYQEVGGSQPIHVVSAYRSPATNAMLAARSSGVADNSQHMRGNAMDFFIPGVPLNRLRAVAMKKQVGGVGYYPTSGSPFVHLDTGNVRAWPRMTTAQLQELFPDGRTLHLPTNGRPLSQEGYKLAQAEWQRCHSVPCGGGSSGTAVASSGGSGRTLMDLFTGGGKTDEPAPVAVAAVSEPQAAPQASVSQPSAPRAAPVPAMRPQMQVAAATQTPPVPAPTPEPAAPEAVPFSSVGSAPLRPEELTVASIAPFPATKPANLRQVTNGETAVMAIAALDAPVPAPRLHMTNPPAEESETVLTAYAAPAAERTLENLIETGTAKVAATPQPDAPPASSLRPGLVSASTMRTASLGSPPAASDPSSAPVSDLFAGTFSALESQPQALPVAQALAELVAREQPAENIAMRDAKLIAPDLDHVTEVMALPAAVSSVHYAIIFEHDEADFDPATELGPHVPRMGVGDFAPVLASDRFQPARAMVVASR